MNDGRAVADGSADLAGSGGTTGRIAVATEELSRRLRFFPLAAAIFAWSDRQFDDGALLESGMISVDGPQASFLARGGCGACTWLPESQVFMA